MLKIQPLLPAHRPEHIMGIISLDLGKKVGYDDWLKNHLEKYESQWVGLSHILWKIKATFETTNQMGISLKYDLDQTNYHLVMTNSLPWKDPPFLRTVNHLFRLGPSKSHG